MTHELPASDSTGSLAPRVPLPHPPYPAGLVGNRPDGTPRTDGENISIYLGMLTGVVLGTCEENGLDVRWIHDEIAPYDVSDTEDFRDGLSPLKQLAAHYEFRIASNTPVDKEKLKVLMTVEDIVDGYWYHARASRVPESEVPYAMTKAGMQRQIAGISPEHMSDEQKQIFLRTVDQLYRGEGMADQAAQTIDGTVNPVSGELPPADPKQIT